MQNHKFIFIGGVHKSGTSLLHDIIRNHPEISGFRNTGVPQDEGQLLQSVYFPAFAYGGAGRFCFQEESYMNENHPLATRENAERLFSDWSQYWDLSKYYLVEKSPPNIIRTRFLQKLFPNSMFLIILRHPIAVAYATKKWRNDSVASLIDHTLCCYERFLEDREFLKKSFVLRYETLVKRPKEVVDLLFSWIGVRSYKIEQKITSGINDSYIKKWNKDQNQPSLLSIIRPHKIRKQNCNREKRANTFGYSLIEPDKIISSEFPYDQ
jgi:hypothetical protein